MKRSNRILKGLTYLLGFIGIAVFAVHLFDAALLSDMFPALFGSGVAIKAMAGSAAVVTDTVTTKDVNELSPDLNVDHVSKKITEMKPSRTPMDTIMRHVKAEKINAFRSEYYAVGTRGIKDTVKTEIAIKNAGLTNLEVNNIKLWAKDDTAFVQGVQGTDGGDLVLFVADVDKAAATLKVQAVNGVVAGEDTEVPPIAANAVLVKMGNAKGEKDAQTSPFAIVPTKEYNYMQIFMAQMEESFYQKIHDKEVDFSFSDYEAQNIYEMKQRMELSYLFGARNKLIDTVTSEERYFTGGVTRFITKALEYGTGGANRDISNNTFIDWSKAIFTGNSGSENRLLFGGAGLTAAISKVPDIQKQLEAGSTEVKWGLTFKKIETMFGNILYFMHNGLDECGWGDNGILLDINNIDKHAFQTMNIRDVKLKDSGQRNAEATVIEECSGLITRYPDTHAIIRPKV
jgi:hypothetical protein